MPSGTARKPRLRGLAHQSRQGPARPALNSRPAAFSVSQPATSSELGGSSIRTCGPVQLGLNRGPRVGGAFGGVDHQDTRSALPAGFFDLIGPTAVVGQDRAAKDGTSP